MKCSKCETDSEGYYTTRTDKAVCFNCVGYAEAQVIAGELGGMNPLNLVEFDRYHRQLAVIRGTSDIVPRN